MTGEVLILASYENHIVDIIDSIVKTLVDNKLKNKKRTDDYEFL
jgi:hypothetical protein